MKRKRVVSNCPVCGRKANVSKWWTRSRKGSVYYYIRFYHSAKNIHFLRSDSTYETFRELTSKAKDLYSTLEDYVYKRMGSRKFAYTSLKREIERSCGNELYNEEFYRAVRKAISVGLIRREKEKSRHIYVKVAAIDSDENVRFDQLAITYDFASKFVKVLLFLEVINVGKVPLSKVPLFVPCGKIDSLKDLHLQAIDETGAILQSNLKITFSATLESIVSISFNRYLKPEEKEFLFLKYQLSSLPETLKFVPPAEVSLLRVTTIAKRQWVENIVRTLVDGAKESAMPFQRMRSYGADRVCLCSEFEAVSKGECISVKFKRQ